MGEFQVNYNFLKKNIGYPKKIKTSQLADFCEVFHYSILNLNPPRTLIPACG